MKYFFAGKELHLSTALVQQPDGSYKEMQVLIPPAAAPIPPTLPQAAYADPGYAAYHQAAPRGTRANHHPLYVEERPATFRPARLINDAFLPQREAQTATVYTPIVHPVHVTEQGQVIVLPAALEATPNIHYTTPSSVPTILHHPKTPPY